MAINTNQIPTLQAEEAKKALMSFYQKPIAQVSTELFFTIGAVVFFALFAIRPTIVTMTELVKEIEDKRKLDTALGIKSQALNTVSTQYFALQDRLYLLDEIIPEDANPEKTFRIIEKVASNNQLIINSLRLQSVPSADEAELPFEQKQVTSMDIVVSVEGDYQAIRRFLDEINTVRPMMTVSNIQFNNTQVDEENSTLTANFTIQAHYYGKVASGANDAAPTTVEELDL